MPCVAKVGIRKRLPYLTEKAARMAPRSGHGGNPHHFHTGALANPADRDNCLQYITAIPLAFGVFTAKHDEDAFHATRPIIDEVLN